MTTHAQSLNLGQERGYCYKTSDPMLRGGTLVSYSGAAGPQVGTVDSPMLTFIGLASSITWVMAAGGWTGLNGESSVPEGGCNFTFID